MRFDRLSFDTMTTKMPVVKITPNRRNGRSHPGSSNGGGTPSDGLPCGMDLVRSRAQGERGEGLPAAEVLADPPLANLFRVPARPRCSRASCPATAAA